jgi:hypothetical protein
MPLSKGSAGIHRHVLTQPKSFSGKPQWPERQPDWVPIRLAVFRFDVSPDPARRLRPFTEAELKASSEAPKTDFSETPPSPKLIPLALDQLAEMLKARSGAREVQIDPHEGTFSFSAQSFSGGGSCTGGPPWAMLATLPDDADAQRETKPLPNKEGFVRISDEEAAREAERWEAIRKEIGFVWHQFMLRSFDRTVSSNLVKLFARVESPTAPFVQVPADAWPVLDIIDWQNGIAIDPQGTLYYSIHAKGFEAKRAIQTARTSVADESRAIKALASELMSHPELTRSQAMSFCETAGYKLGYHGFQYRVWPKARRQAGLEEKAPRGRKKSLR